MLLALPAVLLVMGVPVGRAAAPSGHYTRDGDVVRDNGTGLHWQRQDDGVERTWDAAATYCQTLSLPGTGWRAPTMKELQTLVDETQTSAAVSMDQSAFPGASTKPYWTSSPGAQDGTKAWSVRFVASYTTVVVASKSTPYPVRCVR